MIICLKLLFLIGALLSFVDPITDGLTSWKYFDAGEYLWFALCLVFLIFPSIVYLIFWLCILPSDDTTSAGKMAARLRCCVASMCCPFIPCCGKLYVATTTKKHEDHKLYIEVFNCLEVGIELAPQFILQFYAAMVQTEEVSTIQIVSLTITFLRIGWCYANINEDCTCRLCFGGLISVAARVFAYALFAVALGAWVILVIFLHMALTCVIQRSHKVRAFGYVCLSWLSYTPLGTDKESEEERQKWTSRTFIQPLLHVLEDILMAMLYFVFVDSGRTYPHRLKITLGLIGGTIVGYIVLRLSKFASCQEGRPADSDAEGCKEDLNKEEEEVIDIKEHRQGDTGKQEAENKDKTKNSKFVGVKQFRQWKFRRNYEAGKEQGQSSNKDEGSVVVDIEKPSQPEQSSSREQESVDGGKRSAFGGFAKVRNWKLRRQQEGKGETGSQQGVNGQEVRIEAEPVKSVDKEQEAASGEKSSKFGGFKKIRDWKARH